MTAQPTLLLLDGRPRIDAFAAQRVTVSKLRQAVRASRSGDLSPSLPGCWRPPVG